MLVASFVMNNADSAPALGPREFAIIALGLIAGIIHLILTPPEFQKGAVVFGVLFTLNFLGYFGTVTAGFAPIGFLAPLRMVARVLLLLIAVGSLVGYFVVGVFATIGWVTKVIELVLVILLVTGGLTSGSRRDAPA